MKPNKIWPNNSKIKGFILNNKNSSWNKNNNWL